MNKQHVRFFFDYNSPYSYFAAQMVGAICRDHGAELHFDPVVLGGIFKADETTPIFQKPKRNSYMLEDLKDLSQFHNIPYRQRKAFLFNPILAMRATLKIPQGAEREKAVLALYQEAFVNDNDLGNPEVVVAALNQAGFEGASIVEGANEPATKEELKNLTAEALEIGAFGAPTFVLNGEKMLWGHDRLPLLAFFLNKP